MGRKQKRENVLEHAKQAVEDYLSHFPPERRGQILLGALASAYGNEKGGIRPFGEISVIGSCIMSTS